jgi:Rps23 Pro-64 3,4-dihydroxylase Tpa1-like proline 4-hydroxylase
VDDSQPVKNFMIENFLDDDFANEVHASFPSFSETKQLGGVSFTNVNEQNKYHLTDSKLFKQPLLKLDEMIRSPYFCDLMSHAFGIPHLVGDAKLHGGGIHQTGPGGRLDVHVDFNYIEDQDLYRRMNILIYFNKDWHDDWGGNIELWDSKVKNCIHSFPPSFNRCVVFETNEISFHGVTAVKCPDSVARQSFAGYYYTADPPDWWKGEAHSTVFKARPDEKLKGSILMPASKMVRQLRQLKSKLRRK